MTLYVECHPSFSQVHFQNEHFIKQLSRGLFDPKIQEQRDTSGFEGPELLILT